VGEILALKATEHHLYIYSPYLELLAHHPRHPKGACRIEDASEHHTRTSLRYGIEPVREAFERIGDAAPEFLAGLRHAHPRSAGLHARMILQLKQRYLTDDIARALQHALRYCAFDAASIERILKARAPERTLEAQLREHAGETLAKLMPPVKQRSLEEYQGIFKPGKHDGQQCGDCQQNQKSLPNSQAQDDSEQA
jgi:hypothetical protein